MIASPSNVNSRDSEPVTSQKSIDTSRKGKEIQEFGNHRPCGSSSVSVGGNAGASALYSSEVRSSQSAVS